MTNQINDPWDSSDSPQMRGMEYWGQVQIDTYYAALEKGVGKVPFNPAQHSADKRVTAIEIVILPLAELATQYEVRRSLIAESKAWASIVLPSIKALGLSTRELNGKYAHVVCKPTGRTYMNQSGEQKEETTFSFEAVFSDEKACRTAFNGITPAPVSAPIATPENGNGKARETALKFLKPIVENACRGQTDLEVVKKTITANLSIMPIVNKYFTVESPETLQLIGENLVPF